MLSPIITLTTDWGTRDFFVGMVKGRLLSMIEGVRVVDITHDIPRGDLTRAAFVVKAACEGYPQGTVHIVDVGTIDTPLVVAHQGQYYICSDNGLPHAVFGGDFDAAVRIAEPLSDAPSNTFPAYSLFPQVAQRLCSGVPLDTLGTAMASLNPMRTMSFMEVPNGLIVYVNYIDRYGNIYLSIRYDQFEQVRRGRAFSLRVREHEVREVSKNYIDSAADGQTQGVRLTVSATGYLQLALAKSSMEQLVGVSVLQQLRFDFAD